MGICGGGRCARDRVPKVAKVTVPEIHEALCQQVRATSYLPISQEPPQLLVLRDGPSLPIHEQAAQQRRGGELEDDEEEVGEAERKEAEAKKSPFERKKANPSTLTHRDLTRSTPPAVGR